MIKIDMEMPERCEDCEYCSKGEDYLTAYCEIGKHPLNYNSVIGNDSFYKKKFKDRRCLLIEVKE